MKKTIAILLALVMVLSLAACGGGSATTETPAPTEAETAETTPEPTPAETETPESTPDPVWAIQQTVDEFGDVTEDSTKVLCAQIDGDFSNTATSSSKLTGVVFLYVGGDGDTFYSIENGKFYTSTVVGDHPYFTFRLLEYGDTKATYTNYDTITLKTKIDDTIFEFDQVRSDPPNGDLVVCDTWETTYNALYAGQDVRCIVNIGSSQYNFTLQADNFASAAKDAGMLTETIYYSETDDETLYNDAKALIEAEQYTDAVKTLDHIKDYKDSNEIILEAVCLARYYGENVTLWESYFNKYESTALTGEEIQAIIVGDWYQYEGSTYNTFSDDGKYTSTIYKGTVWDYRIEDDKLIRQLGEQNPSVYDIYPFYKNAYVFAFHTKDGSISYDLLFNSKIDGYK